MVGVVRHGHSMILILPLLAPGAHASRGRSILIVDNAKVIIVLVAVLYLR